MRGVLDKAAVLQRYLDRDGRLIAMPRKQQARMVLLHYCAELIPQRTDLTESQVNNALRPVSDDVAMLRRYLVDHGLLNRRTPGIYWRV